MLKILVIRNDKLGDFVLSLPSFKLLKDSLPNSTVYALVPEYTAPIAEYCPWIDEVIIDDTTNGYAWFKLLRLIKKKKIDVAISLFSTFRVALLLCLACIPYRLAPKTKLAQVFYTHRLKQNRSMSIKAEYRYNLELVEYYLKSLSFSVNSDLTLHRPFLSIDSNKTNGLKNKFVEKYSLSKHQATVLIHPCTGGSAEAISDHQWCILIALLAKQPINIVLLAGPGELERVRFLSKRLEKNSISLCTYHSNQGLVAFAESLLCVDAVIAASTGTLHLAAALNRYTIGFFSGHRKASVPRWTPINETDRQLNLTAPEGYNKEEEFMVINMEELYKYKIHHFIMNIKKQ